MYQTDGALNGGPNHTSMFHVKLGDAGTSGMFHVEQLQLRSMLHRNIPFGRETIAPPFCRIFQPRYSFDFPRPLFRPARPTRTAFGDRGFGSWTPADRDYGSCDPDARARHHRILRPWRCGSSLLCHRPRNIRATARQADRPIWAAKSIARQRGCISSSTRGAGRRAVGTGDAMGCVGVSRSRRGLLPADHSLHAHVLQAATATGNNARRRVLA